MWRMENTLTINFIMFAHQLSINVAAAVLPTTTDSLSKSKMPQTSSGKVWICVHRGFMKIKNTNLANLVEVLGLCLMK